MNYKNDNETNSLTSLGLVFLIIFVLWVFVLFYSIIVALPSNPFSVNLSSQKIIRQVFPQGWGFYSKSPREETLNIYNLSNENNPIAWPNNKVENIFGIYRYGRSQGIELGLIVYNLPKSVKWKKCNGTGTSCVNDSDPEVPVNNSTPSPTICGKILIAREEPIPWSYAKYTNKSKSEVVKVDVKCTRS
ncbi:TPA: SdpA family antimicrobial peptide system protein [Bacillus cereus]